MSIDKKSLVIGMRLGGGGGTSDYEELTNKPKINDTTLTGNKTGAALGLVDTSGGTMSGNLAMGSNKITGLASGTADTDAVTLAQLNDAISTNTAFFRGSFATKAALLAVAWQTTNPSADYYVTNNDYAIVLADETKSNECWRYIYVSGTGWTAQYRINETPLTQAQIDALNSGATAAKITQITTNKNDISAIKDGAELDSFADVETELADKQDKLTGSVTQYVGFDASGAAAKSPDTTPTQSSTALVTSGGVHTELAKKLNLTGGTMSGDITMGGSRVTGLGAPTANADAATKKYVDDEISDLETVYLKKIGGTMTGAIAMSSNKITGLANGTAATDAAAYGQIPTATATTPKMDGTAAIGSDTTWAKGDHVHPTDTTRAPLASPALTGTPTAPTAAVGTNTTQIATTAFVKAAIDKAITDNTYNGAVEVTP